MPIYNGSNYIEKTISYILESNQVDFELVLVNDGSKDNSLTICMEYAKKDTRVKVVNKENGGIADARNYGITYANGEYIAFVDQDDYIELKVLMKILGSHREDLVIFSTIKDYGNKFEACDIVSSSKILDDRKEIFKNCIWPMVYPTESKGDVSYFGHVWQGIYKRSVVTKNNIEFKRYVSIEDDFLFLLEFLLYSESVALITDIGYRWVINYESTTYHKMYIENLQNKCERFYAYVNNILTRSDLFSENYQKNYVKMTKQVLGVRLVINEGYNKNFRSSLKILRTYIKQNRKEFKGKYLGKSDSRKSAKIIFYMLKFNMILSVMILQKMIIFMHEIKYSHTRKERII